MSEEEKAPPMSNVTALPQLSARWLAVAVLDSSGSASRPSLRRIGLSCGGVTHSQSVCTFQGLAHTHKAWFQLYHVPLLSC